MENSIIKIESVSKSFKDSPVLKQVSISFEAGRIHGIIGRNGSGKTVLFKCICGLMRPDSGIISVHGEIVGKDIDIPRDIGAIIEIPGFLPNYSGLKNLKFLANIKRNISTEKIIQTMEIVGLDPCSKKHVGKYSLGMRQRLGIAQAIMEDPAILILDEPMNGLDKNGVTDMRSLFLLLKKKGKTILVASHNPDDIKLLCDTTCEMDDGILTVQ